MARRKQKKLAFKLLSDMPVSLQYLMGVDVTIRHGRSFVL